MLRRWHPWTPVRALALAVLLLALAPAGAQAFTKAIWGDVYRSGVNQFPLYHKLGVTTFEIDLDWADVAPTRPRHPTSPRDRAYHWPKEVRQAVTEARIYHMHVLLLVATAPRWSNHRRARNFPPSNPADYAAFVTAAAKRYPSVHLWMIYGEPTRAPNFGIDQQVSYKAKTLTKAQQVAPHLYARILDDAYGALKKVSRKNLVIGGCTYTTGNIDTQQWIENLRLPNGKRPRMDMWAHNPFSYEKPSFSIPYSKYGEVQFSDLPELAKWLDRYLRRGMPIFVSEFTIPTGPDEEFNFYVDPGVAAQWTKAALKLARHWKRIYGMGWIHVYDEPPTSSGGLLTVNGQPKPDYYAFKNG